MSEKKANHGNLSIHTENIFPIIKKWLYSEHDIFLRELISNGVDAMRKRQAVDHDVNVEDLKIELKIDKKKKTLQVIDSGIGMDADEVVKYINQIAFSGAEDFVEKFKDKQNQIIGHFGLGFYSSFMVAERVTIDTLSYKEGSNPAFWECEGDTEYDMGKGKRKKVGTTVTIFLNKDSEEYLEESRLKELVEKYSNFMPFPIMIGEDEINQKEALWNRKPKDVSDDEYKDFYKKLFHDYNDPLFQIHLNVDFPFNLKGILYFPKIKNQLELNQGKVKLFCNNVFVADDLKGIIPEFLLMLKGGIDIPDIPLNVSRSFLQQDKQVEKISQYIVKKVADNLKSTFKDDRKAYEAYWEDINQFIKYGILTDEKFMEAMKDYIIFKSSNGDYVTVSEYLDRNKSDEKPQKIFYAPSEDTQVSYLEMMKDQGIEVIFTTSLLDSHLFQQFEMKNPDTQYVRIDSEINNNLVNDELDKDNIESMSKLEELFEVTLNDKLEASFSKDSYSEFLKNHPEAATALQGFIRTEDDYTYVKPYELNSEVREQLGNKAFKAIKDQLHPDVKVEIKSLKSDSIPAMVVFNEFMRRFQEMNQMGMPDDGMFKNHNLVINSNNSTVKKIGEFVDAGRKVDAELMVNYVHDLALMEQKSFNGKELQEFVKKANRILDLIK